MKTLIISFATLLAVATACTESHNIVITGTVNVESGKVYLQKFVNKIYFTVDSADISGGQFQFALNAEIPEIYSLAVDTALGGYMIFLDGNPVTVNLDTSRYYRRTTVEGSALQDLFVSYKKEDDVQIDEFIRQNPSSLVAAYALYRDYSYRLTPEEIRDNIALLDPSLLQTQYVKILQELVLTLDRVSKGNPAPDFTLNDPDGQPVKLSDKIGRGYLLLDFWAAWCGPCRRENPNVVAVYDKYKDKGFDILGVSLDRDKASWLKAIETDRLPWTHVSDLQYWNSAAAALYGVRAIPANFLIDKNGIIVAKNLRGVELDDLVGGFLNH